MAEPTPKSRQPLGLFPDKTAIRLYDGSVEDVASFEPKQESTPLDPNNGDRTRHRSLVSQLWTLDFITHVLNKGGRAVTSPLDSAQFNARATLRFGDSSRPGANEQGTPQE